MGNFIKSIGSFFNRLASLIGWSFLIGLVLFLVIATMAINAINKEKEAFTGRFTGPRTDKAVAVLEISGEIGAMVSASKFREQLSRQIGNSQVKAVVVQINSQGVP